MSEFSVLETNDAKVWVENLLKRFLPLPFAAKSMNRNQQTSPIFVD